MCDICRKIPCDNRCPNVADPRKIGICSICKEDILIGWDYYEFDETLVCDNCIFEHCNQFKKIAGDEYYEY